MQKETLQLRHFRRWAGFHAHTRKKQQQTNKKTEDGENLFFQALVNRFWLTS